MNTKIKLFLLPIWEYLNQPLFNSQSVWKPSRFSYLYTIKLLENCWKQESAWESHHRH